MDVIRTKSVDLQWQVLIGSRRAVLWLGPSTMTQLAGSMDALLRLVARPWAAVYNDCPEIDAQLLPRTHDDFGTLVLRVFDDAAPTALLPINRLPIYSLRGPKGSRRPLDVTNPSELVIRLQMLQHAPIECEIFAVGLKSSDDLVGVSEAIRTSERLRRWILVGEPDKADSLTSIGAEAERVVVWNAQPSDLQEILSRVAVVGPFAVDTSIAVKARGGLATVDLKKAIDPSLPITDAFELVPASHALARDRGVSREMAKQFLADPTADWQPYASNLPFPRHKPFLKPLRELLESRQRDGGRSSIGVKLRTDSAAGTTTTLRSIAMEFAAEGFPVLVARPEVAKFEVNQISNFIRSAVEVMAEHDKVDDSTPWLIVFDVQHLELEPEFLRSLPSVLSRLIKHVVVLSAVKGGAGSGGSSEEAGLWRTLPVQLDNRVSEKEAEDIGTHFARVLPEELRRQPDEWKALARANAEGTSGSSPSLFWLALRFWLLRVPGSEKSFRQFLHELFVRTADGNGPRYSAMLEVAVLSKHRLQMPLALLDTECAKELKKVWADQHNALGIRARFNTVPPSVSFEHEWVSEEILRIALTDDTALRAVGATKVAAPFLLELHLLARIIERKAGGTPECIRVLEKIATNVLRVDRNTPNTWNYKKEIVDTLQHAPDAVFDHSQLFNHHLAIARHHLAMNAPADWKKQEIVLELDLAVEHLMEALQRVKVYDEEQRESPLALHLSLALTYDARSQVEAKTANDAGAAHYRGLAEKAYRKAEGLDADSPYVLENYARFLLRIARGTQDPEQKARIIAEAISRLQREIRNDEIGDRHEPALNELASAFALLGDKTFFEELERMAAKGSEPAVVVLARHILGADDVAAAELQKAETLLLSVPPAKRSWLATELLYELTSELYKFDFPRRLGVLEDLARHSDYSWPLQLKVDHAILMLQAGSNNQRRAGVVAFGKIRSLLERSHGTALIPDELRYLADPARGYQIPLQTVVTVTKAPEARKDCFAVPNGWGTNEIIIRPSLFSRDRPQVGQDFPCYVLFTNFGPQAVPLTTRL